MAVIYKLTRKDGLEYIGVAKDLADRVRVHRKSDRFKHSPIESVEVLLEADWDECDRREEEFIALYDTYKNGLNCTKRGKGRSECEKFNTTGFVFGEESRRKMSESAKRRGPNNKGYKPSDETKALWSKIRKGKYWGNRKIERGVWASIIDDFNSFELSIEDCWGVCKKSQRGVILPLDQFISGNGRPINKITIFSKAKAVEIGVTPNRIEQIIKNGY